MLMNAENADLLFISKDQHFSESKKGFYTAEKFK
jgi:hypothetical protein